jgi:hypothetical protein
MVHSVPEKDIEALVGDLRERGAYLFITDLTAGFYEAFGEYWGRFADAMAKS